MPIILVTSKEAVKLPATKPESKDVTLAAKVSALETVVNSLAMRMETSSNEFRQRSEALSLLWLKSCKQETQLPTLKLKYL